MPRRSGKLLQRPDMRFVSVKSEQQQAVLSLHRLRAQWVSIRTQQANQIRGLLYEFGMVVAIRLAELAQGSTSVDRRSPDAVAHRTARATARHYALRRPVSMPSRSNWRTGNGLSPSANASWPCPASAHSLPPRWLPASPMRGQFRSARQFAAYLGLVPRQSGTGGRVKLLGISKRGDPYLRTLLMQGARSVLLSQSRQGCSSDPWLGELLGRRPNNVVVVALANKMARTIWALLAHDRTFDAHWHRGATQAAA